MISSLLAIWPAGQPIAHVGHWLANLLYLLPVLVLAGGIAYQRIADRKARARDRSSDSERSKDDTEVD